MCFVNVPKIPLKLKMDSGMVLNLLGVFHGAFKTVLDGF